MPESGSRNRPSYSARLLHAFVELLAEYDETPGMSPKLLETTGDRVPVDIAHDALSAAVERTRDPDLGLRAARRHVTGDAGTFYYVVSSSPTVRDALTQASRFIRLLNDAVELGVRCEGNFVFVRFENSIVLPRAAIDYQVGSFFNNHLREWLGKHSSGVTVHFTHHAPENPSEYEGTFAPATVNFSEPFVGFGFDKALLELPLPTADANLFAVMAPVADEMLGNMARTTVTADVRRIIHERLPLGAPDFADIAAQLTMSIRTLARRLENEGTTFRELVDDVRRTLAVDCVAHRDVGFSELSYRLGFSHCAAFHRAFRRWTGQTPLAYRRLSGR
jgi:AraC-like DNA-binding protein